MEDKIIMDTILSNVKGCCDLMLHGSIESSTPNVHSVFKTALNDSLDMQNQIYSKMSQMGWYPQQKAQQQQIDAAKQKYSPKN